MDIEQTTRLVAYIDARLGRVSQRNPLTVEAWHDDLAHVPYDVAKAAVQRITSRPDVITVHIGHILAEIRNAGRSPVELDLVLEQCARYYRDTDDNLRWPMADDHSLAARVYRRAGGFAALHSPQWHTKRLTDAYREVVAEDDARAIAGMPAIEGGDWPALVGHPAVTVEVDAR